MGVDTAGLTTDLTTVFEDLDPAKTAAEAAASVAQAIHDNVDSAPDHTDSVAPTVNDDVSLGYIVGSTWIIVGSDEYVCLDNTNGAAVWRNTTSGGGGGGITGPGSSTVNHVVLWNATDGTVVKDGGALAAVATSGAYSDISGAPSSLPPSGSAGGDLTGSYPNPSVAKVAGVTPSAYVLTLLDDADAATARTTLGVTSKKIQRLIKDSKLKVQAAIQGDAVRVTGAKRDDLQAAMALIKKDIPDLPLSFNNFRD